MGADRPSRAGVLRWAAWLVVVAAAFPASAQSILQRRVDVQTGQVRLSEALAAIAHDGRFKLSYNAAMLNGDSLVTVAVDNTVEAALRGLLPGSVALKESGEHIILLETGAGRRKFQARGSVVDGVSGAPIARASIYEVQERYSGRSDGNGAFLLEVSGVRDRTPLLVARAGYSDTVVYVGRDGDAGRIVLRPREKLEYLEVKCVTADRCGVEELGVARLLVANDQMDAAANLVQVERRGFQASLWPRIGTNREFSGAVVNTVSLNLVGGYARGLDGVEVAGGFNLERRDVKGLQVAGAANLVGGLTNGVQVAGGGNHTMRSLNGVQVAGGFNTVWDTLVGAQVSGGANVVKGHMRGTQVTGGNNVALQDVDGAQVAGGVNVCVRDVHKVQVAGGINYGRSVAGAQVAGGINVSQRTVSGGQVAAGINYARQVTGAQVAGGINVVADTVRGGQVGTVNFARVVQGGQVGVINLSDTITGSSVGLFSFAVRGYHRLDASATGVLPLTVSFRTGTRYFYNVLSWSPPVGPDERWAFGYGFGTEPRIGKHALLNIELAAEQVVEQREWVDAMNILSHLNFFMGYDLGRYVVVSAGPSIDLLVSDWRDAEGRYLSALPPSDPAYQERAGRSQLSGWLGWRAGVGVRF